MDRSRTSPCWPPTTSANQRFHLARPAPGRKITGNVHDGLPPPALAFPRFGGGPPGWSGRPGRPLTSACLARLPSFGQRTSVDQVPPCQLRPGTSAAPGGPVSQSWREQETSNENATLQRSLQEAKRVSLNCVPVPDCLQEIERASMENALLEFSLKERHSAPITDSETQSTRKRSNVDRRNTLQESAHQVDRHALERSPKPKKQFGLEPTRNSAVTANLFCGFCKKNGELASTYAAHSLRYTKPDGTVVVSCPVLRGLRCDICGATEDRAHTRSHCPLGRDCLPVAVLLKSTARRCDGTLRLKDQYHRKS